MAGTRASPGGSHTKVTVDIEEFYDAVEVGRGLADDEADLLDDARESGELTGWE